MPTAHFDSHAWVVHEPFSEAEIARALDLTTVPLPGTIGRITRAPPLSIPTRAAARYIELIRSRAHEWTHYRQHISTPLGLFHHRLSVVRGEAVSRYYECPDAIKHQPFIAVYAGLVEGRPWTDADEWLAPWVFADHLGRTLWALNPPMREVIAMWEFITDHARGVLEYSDHTDPRQLTTSRALTEPAVPDSVPQVSQLIEAYAKYCEVVEVKKVFPKADVAALIAPSVRGDSALVFERLFAQLRLPFGHHLGGALLEFALEQFVDPFLAGPGEPLVWEEIYPGFALNRAVDRLERFGRFPSTPTACYDLACQVMRDASPEAYGRQRAAAADALDGVAKRPRSDNEQFPMAYWQMQTLYEALALRFERPGAFFAPDSVLTGDHFNAWNRLTELSQPPMLAKLEGLIFTRSEFNNTDLSQSAIQFAFWAYVCDDLARSGRLAKSLDFMRHLDGEPSEELRYIVDQLLPDYRREQSAHEDRDA